MNYLEQLNKEIMIGLWECEKPPTNYLMRSSNMNNRIFEDVYKARKGMYTHCLEVSSVWDLESSIEAFISETSNKGYTQKDYVEFFNTMDIYYLPLEGEEEDPLEEEAIHNASISEIIASLY